MNIDIKRQELTFEPNPKKVIARFFYTNDQRAKILITRIVNLSDQEADDYLQKTLREFQKRHRNISRIFISHYHQVKRMVGRIVDTKTLSSSHKILIGSYFTMEYAVESAALFNPSIIEDPDQEGLYNQAKRVLISFRATGEGHISSLIFKRAIIDKHNNLIPDDDGIYVGKPQIERNHRYHKKEFIEKLLSKGIGDDLIVKGLASLKDHFNYEQLHQTLKPLISLNSKNERVKEEYRKILEVADYNYEVEFSYDTDISERVIFPYTESESKGIEDARFVKFTDDDGTVKYYGTYTGYNGREIYPKLMETQDFYKFKVTTMHGDYAVDKNMALFPRKINGKYVMISRYDGFNNYIMFSDNIMTWNSAQKLMEPKYPWEFIQIGNCGSPIETKYGWLLITHGVGPVRSYTIGAILLDLDDPTKVIKRLESPLLIPTRTERAGYVPNVVYSCGCYLKGETLFLPYAVSDWASKIATANVNEIVDNMVDCY
jgi:predicted GH43/DUF377 family glycosyl hydrolase